MKKYKQVLKKSNFIPNAVWNRNIIVITYYFFKKYKFIVNIYYGLC